MRVNTRLAAPASAARAPTARRPPTLQEQAEEIREPRVFPWTPSTTSLPLRCSSPSLSFVTERRRRRNFVVPVATGGPVPAGRVEELRRLPPQLPVPLDSAGELHDERIEPPLLLLPPSIHSDSGKPLLLLSCQRLYIAAR
jgi:hypothetical protein